MRIFNFLKRFSKIKVENEIIPEKEKVSLFGLEKWVESKISGDEEKEREIFLEIKKEIEEFSGDIKEKIKIVEEFDVNSKKAEDRFKWASEEGRKKYIESLENLIESLKSIKNKNLEKVANEISSIFSEFNKKSYKSYERATILIGKEMASLRNLLKNFYGRIIGIFDRNKNIIDGFRRLHTMKSKLNLLENKEREIKKIKKDVKSIDEEISIRQNEDKEVSEEEERIKKSQKYIELRKKAENMKNLKEKLSKDVFDLRKEVDFKVLGNFHHIFKEKMHIVNEYKNNFELAFHKDDGKAIFELIKEAKLDDKNIISIKISNINSKKEEISNLENEIKKEILLKKPNELYSKREKLKSEIENLKNMKDRTEKKLEELNLNKDKIIKEIKESSKKLGVEIQ
ncbi:MAG: hypothetical protein WDZ77_02990 [Candidatus Pacearchaeota archaeon]